MMREVMQNSGLSIFAEVGLLIFVAVFLATAVRAAMMGKAEINHIEQLPLNEGEPVSTEQGGQA